MLVRGDGALAVAAEVSVDRQSLLADLAWNVVLEDDALENDRLEEGGDDPALLLGEGAEDVDGDQSPEQAILPSGLVQLVLMVAKAEHEHGLIDPLGVARPNVPLIVAAELGRDEAERVLPGVDVGEEIVPLVGTVAAHQCAAAMRQEGAEVPEIPIDDHRIRLLGGDLVAECPPAVDVLV